MSRLRVLAVLSAAALAACGGAARPAPARGVSGALTVLAAASLTEAFQEAGAAFQSRHPGARVDFSFGGSSTLAAQLEQGAPGDVFASADQANMERVGGLLAGRPRLFASNRLQIAVAPGNPRHLASLADLARPGLVVVLCAPQVPCGTYSRQALARAGVSVTPRSQETDVRSVLTKVATGEADAGIVYTTDVRSSAGKVSGVDIPESQNVPALYPVAVLKGAQNRPAAEAFVDFLTSADGQAILERHGFARP